MRWLIAVSIAVVATGCGNRCKDVQHAKAALARTGAPNRGADVRVTVPYSHANRTLAGLLQQEPLSVSLASPDIAVFPIQVSLTAVVRELVLRPGSPGTARFATKLEIYEGDTLVTDMTALIEVGPQLVRDDDGTALVIGIGPQNLVRAKPTLGPEAKRTLGSAVTRWMPERLKGKIPSWAMEGAAKKLGAELTGTAWDALRGTLLKRLGDISRMKLRLPDVPVARHMIRSDDDALVVEIETDLPVRRGLAPASTVPTTTTTIDDVQVAISGSAAAELANWALDHGHAPQRYNRNLNPTATGEFHPRFDYVAEDIRHPLKVFAFQQGGCSYHKVGVRAAIAIEGDQLKATAFDRELEAQSANPVIELGAWAKLGLFGWVDRSKKVAAHTRLAIGNRTLDTRVISAAIAGDELRFALRFEATATPPTPPLATPVPATPATPAPATAATPAPATPAR